MLGEPKVFITANSIIWGSAALGCQCHSREPLTGGILEQIYPNTPNPHDGAGFWPDPAGTSHQKCSRHQCAVPQVKVPVVLGIHGDAFWLPATWPGRSWHVLGLIPQEKKASETVCLCQLFPIIVNSMGKFLLNLKGGEKRYNPPHASQMFF